MAGVDLAVVDEIAEVRLARPDRHNALDMTMFLALRDVQRRVREVPRIKAVLLHGEGASFCSGLDVAAAAAGELDFERLWERQADRRANLAQEACIGFRELAVPVIAAIHGACFGGGLQIALGADIRIAAPDARLSVMEIELGLVPDMGLTAVIPGLVGEDVAMDLTLTGRKVSGEEALAVGLVTRTDQHPEAAARELARLIATKSPGAVRAAKALLRENWTAPEAAALELETRVVRTLVGGAGQLGRAEKSA